MRTQIQTTANESQMDQLNKKNIVNYKGEEFKKFNTIIENNKIKEILFASLETKKTIKIELN